MNPSFNLAALITGWIKCAICLIRSLNHFLTLTAAIKKTVNKMQTNVCILLTNENCYAIMREYRWKYRLYSFAVLWSLYGVSSLSVREAARRKVFRACGERSSPRSFSANCAAPEPSERRAKTGLFKRTIFWTQKAFVWLSFFVGRWGAFLWYDFSKKSRYAPLPEKDARW